MDKAYRTGLPCIYLGGFVSVDSILDCPVHRVNKLHCRTYSVQLPKSKEDVYKQVVFVLPVIRGGSYL
jgi:hypothetical protein